MSEPQSLAETLLSPAVLITFIICALLAAAIVWLALLWQRRQYGRIINQQRVHQEAAVERLLDAVAQDKHKVVAEYEAALQQRDARLTALEAEANRLRDRLSSSGLLGLFGGRQRDVISALLLENEQLHELLAQKQAQLRDLVSDMTAKLVDRLEEQAQESAKAVRYKQALLSAFLEREETRRLLDQMIQEGKVTSSAPALPERDHQPQ